MNPRHNPLQAWGQRPTRRGDERRVRKTSPNFTQETKDERGERREQKGKHKPFSFLHPSDFYTEWFDTMIYCNPRNMGHTKCEQGPYNEQGSG